MTQPTLTDRDVKAMFDARAAGPVTPDLAARIHAAAATTRQRRAFRLIPGFGGPMRTFALAAVLGASSLAVIGGLLIAGNDTPVVSPPPSTPPAVTPGPSPSPSPSPTPEPSPTPTPLPPGVREWPPITEKVRQFGLGFLTVASVPLYAGPSEGAEILDQIPSIGVDLFFVEGPVEAEGYVWWQARPYRIDQPYADTYPLGWLRTGVINADEPPVLGYTPDCPTSPIRIESRESFNEYELIACFGSDDFVITGELSCSEADVDGPTDGPAWRSADRACSFDDAAGAPLVFIYGDPVFDLVTPGQVTRGTFAVTGHLNDAQATLCEASEFEGGPNGQEAILGCRLSFVATAVERLD